MSNTPNFDALPIDIRLDYENALLKKVAVEIDPTTDIAVKEKIYNELRQSNDLAMGKGRLDEQRERIAHLISIDADSARMIARYLQEAAEDSVTARTLSRRNLGFGLQEDPYGYHDIPRIQANGATETAIAPPPPTSAPESLSPEQKADLVYAETMRYFKERDIYVMPSSLKPIQTYITASIAAVGATALNTTDRGKRAAKVIAKGNLEKLDMVNGSAIIAIVDRLAASFPPPQPQIQETGEPTDSASQLPSTDRTARKLIEQGPGGRPGFGPNTSS